MFRRKESSNRIKLSRLVQELLNFGVFGFLRLLGVGGGWMGVGCGWRVPPTHVHMHACICTCTHAHACMVNMIISCKWPPPLDLGKSRGFPMMSYAHACTCTCVHMYAYACGWCALCHHPLPLSTYPPTLEGGTPGIIQNSIVLELIKIFQFCLKI